MICCLPALAKSTLLWGPSSEGASTMVPSLVPGVEPEGSFYRSSADLSPSDQPQTPPSSLISRPLSFSSFFNQPDLYWCCSQNGTKTSSRLQSTMTRPRPRPGQDFEHPRKVTTKSFVSYFSGVFDPKSLSQICVSVISTGPPGGHCRSCLSSLPTSDSLEPNSNNFRS